MRGWPGSVSEISVFPTGISVSGLEIQPYEHFSQVTGMNCDGAVRDALPAVFSISKASLLTAVIQL